MAPEDRARHSQMVASESLVAVAVAVAVGTPGAAEGGSGSRPNGDAYVGAGGGGGANFASPLASSVTFGLGDGKPRLVITPRPASAIRVSRIFYNSPGPDTGSNRSHNGEWIQVRNTGRTSRQLRGWWISDAEGHVYRFGRLALRPGASVTVHTGRGRDTTKDRYWNRRGYVWDNQRDLARLHRADSTLVDQCHYDNAHASQLRC